MMTKEKWAGVAVGLFMAPFVLILLASLLFVAFGLGPIPGTLVLLWFSATCFAIYKAN